MRLKLFAWFGLGLYTLLSCADWVMTFALLRAHPGAVEANPLAAACLELYGWTGLGLYKAGGVFAFVGAVVLLIRRHRPAVASAVVAFGCVVLLSVTVYTHRLICDAHREATERAQDVAWPKSAQRNNTSEFAVPEQCWFAPPAESTTEPEFASVPRK